MKLKTILLIERGMSMGLGSMSSNDTKLRPYPGSMDDIESWNGITEHEKWFCYSESNDWDSKKSGVSVYITEGEPHKYWIKVKTHGLRKPNDTNEGVRQRVRKHTNKVSGAWVSAAKKIHNNPEINEVGNEIPISWNEAFKRALEDPKVSIYVAESGESKIKRDMAAIADPINFTPRLEENMKQRVWSAVVLQDHSRIKLLKELGDKIPEGYEKIAHHMTIKFDGELPPEQKKDLNKKVTLTATEIGISDKAIAVKVTGYWSSNSNPHITLAVNKSNGGKPKHSNDITNWEKLETPIQLEGKVEEIPFKYQ